MRMTSAAAGAGQSCNLRVGGIDCAACARTIERALRTLPGVRAVDVNVMGGTVKVEYVDDALGRGDFSRAIERVGFAVEDERGHEARVAAPRAFWSRRGRLVMTAGAGATLLLALLAGHAGAPASIGMVLFALASVLAGWYVIPRGVQAARQGALDMNFLMSVAAVGAWVIGERAEAAATLFLFGVAELLERYSMDRARTAITSLMDLSPLEARVRRNGEESSVPAVDVGVGETVIVRPGEKLPVDGEVLSGRSSVNQAPITGESMPVDKAAGADVFAGSLNGHGVLEIRSTRRSTDTTLARIIHAVEEAQASRAPSQTVVDRFARVYTPAVVAIAVLIAVVPPLVGDASWESWVYRALTLLVVACPCALVISTPVTFVSGLAGAARAGILIKGGAHLENLGRASVLAIDKTGTLTEGRPVVTDLVTPGDVAGPEVLRLAMGVERHSEHPLAQAVLAYGAERGVSQPTSTNFQALVGRGARATIGDRQVFVGSKRLYVEQGDRSPRMDQLIAQLEGEGNSVVVVLDERDPVGLIGIADRVRPEARTAIAALRHLGVDRVVMLTGDNQATARAIGERVGITEVHAELLPEDKLRDIRKLIAQGARVAFVGDGINDAPALAASTVGIAMGAAGTDVAIETADVALMGDDLSRLAIAVRFSRKSVAIVRQNIAFALIVKAVFVVLALSGQATLWMAVAADMGASLIVIVNGLRALRVGPRLRPIAVVRGIGIHPDAVPECQ